MFYPFNYVSNITIWTDYYLDQYTYYLMIPLQIEDAEAKNHKRYLCCGNMDSLLRITTEFTPSRGL